MKICSVEECQRKPYAFRLCSMHYTRWRKHGDPSVVKVKGSTPAEERFWSKVDKNGPVVLAHFDECWVWTACADKDGYGSFWASESVGTKRAHRFSYESQIGAIPAVIDGKPTEIDHLCRNHACVRPSHLEIVTRRENMIRGFSLPAMNSRKTHCSKGHKFDEENTVLEPGRRRCRRCKMPIAEFRSLTALEAEVFGFRLDENGKIA